jgi:hypothetical protein
MAADHLSFSVQPHFELEESLAEPVRPVLARESYKLAKRKRTERAEERPLVLTNCRLLDVGSQTCSSYGHSVVILGGKITTLDQQIPPPDAVVINCMGMVLMPGKRPHCPWPSATFAAGLNSSSSYPEQQQP